jgi:hypothetical protein
VGNNKHRWRSRTPRPFVPEGQRFIIYRVSTHISSRSHGLKFIWLLNVLFFFILVIGAHRLRKLWVVRPSPQVVEVLHSQALSTASCSSSSGGLTTSALFG